MKSRVGHLTGIKTKDLRDFGAPIAAFGLARSPSIPVRVPHYMNAALYFELVDAVARVDGPAELNVVAERISATSMHPIERRVLDRALRARTEALAIHRQLLKPDFSASSPSDSAPLVARG